MTTINTPLHMDQDELIKLVQEIIDNMSETTLEPITIDDKQIEDIKTIEQHRKAIEMVYSLSHL